VWEIGWASVLVRTWSASSAEDQECVELSLRSRIFLYGMQRDTFSCVLPIVWEIGWASVLVRTWWQRVTLLPAVENRTSVKPVITIWDIQDLKELHKSSIFVHQLTDCRIYKAAGSCKFHPKQVTNDAKGRVCNLGSGAELWMSGDGTRFVLAAAIMSVGERATERERERERVAGD